VVRSWAVHYARKRSGPWQCRTALMRGKERADLSVTPSACQKAVDERLFKLII
jgi:hypothetical protein